MCEKYNIFTLMDNFKKLKAFKPLPSCLTIKDSLIHGLGLFATEDIQSDTELGITHIKDDRFLHNYIRTSLGGFFNHSTTPNCQAIYENDFIKLNGEFLEMRLSFPRSVFQNELCGYFTDPC